jgi:hypothetical protein
MSDTSTAGILLADTEMVVLIPIEDSSASDTDAILSVHTGPRVSVRLNVGRRAMTDELEAYERLNYSDIDCDHLLYDE